MSTSHHQDLCKHYSATHDLMDYELNELEEIFLKLLWLVLPDFA